MGKRMFSFFHSSFFILFIKPYSNLKKTTKKPQRCFQRIHIHQSSLFIPLLPVPSSLFLTLLSFSPCLGPLNSYLSCPPVVCLWFHYLYCCSSLPILTTIRRSVLYSLIPPPHPCSVRILLESASIRWAAANKA